MKQGNNVVAESTLVASRVDQEIDAIRTALRSKGLHLRIGRDFEFFADAIRETPGRSRLHSQFDPDGDMHGASDAFWIAGFSEDGDLLHSQALQLQELGGRSIADHIAEYLDQQEPAKPPVFQKSIRAKAGPHAKRIRGNVVYHGEMWIAEALRDRATASLVNRLGMYMAVREWNPDCIFGLMSWALACNGFGSRIGYMHTEALALTWDRRDQKSQYQVWSVYMERDDIEFLLDLPAVEFASVLSRSFK